MAAMAMGIAGMIRICEAVGGDDAPEALRLLRKELPAEQPHGVNQHNGAVDNIKSTQGGTSPDYSLRRLKRDRPDLAEQQ